MGPEKERQTTGNIKCGHCLNTAPMTLETKYVEEHKDVFNLGDDTYTGYEVCTCPVCKGVTLRSYFWHDLINPEDVSYKILYPAAEKKQEGLPLRVQKSYDAAQNVRHIDVNAYGVLLGRVLEIVCDDRGASGDTLDLKLKSLATKGEIPEKLVAVATGLRQMRNIGAHAGLGELTEREVPVLNDLTRAILDYVYSAPHLISLAESSLSKLKANRSI